MDPIVSCPDCGTKNKISQAPSGQIPVCGKCTNQLPWLVEASDASFDDEVSAGVLVVADFWAPWCGPCRIVSPVLDELAKENRGSLKVVKLNVDNNPVVARKFNIRGIPTLVFFKDGDVVDTVVGALPKATLASKIAALA